MKAWRDRPSVSHRPLLILLLLVPISTSAQVPEQLWVHSKDGTRISVQKTGDGPALLLIHGSSIDGSSWQRVLPGLSKHFTVYVMDRPPAPAIKVITGRSSSYSAVAREQPVPPRRRSFERCPAQFRSVLSRLFRQRLPPQHAPASKLQPLRLFPSLRLCLLGM